MRKDALQREALGKLISDGFGNQPVDLDLANSIFATVRDFFEDKITLDQLHSFIKGKFLIIKIAS